MITLHFDIGRIGVFTSRGLAVPAGGCYIANLLKDGGLGVCFL